MIYSWTCYLFSRYGKLLFKDSDSSSKLILLESSSKSVSLISLKINLPVSSLTSFKFGIAFFFYSSIYSDLINNYSSNYVSFFGYLSIIFILFLLF